MRAIKTIDEGKKFIGREISLFGGIPVYIVCFKDATHEILAELNDKDGTTIWMTAGDLFKRFNIGVCEGTVAEDLEDEYETMRKEVVLNMNKFYMSFIAAFKMKYKSSDVYECGLKVTKREIYVCDAPVINDLLIYCNYQSDTLPPSLSIDYSIADAVRLITWLANKEREIMK